MEKYNAFDRDATELIQSATNLVVEEKISFQTYSIIYGLLDKHAVKEYGRHLSMPQ